MLQLVLAVAFSAAPLTLYVPPVRCLNTFVAAVEAIVREVAEYYSLRVNPRFQFAVRRILAVVTRLMGS